MMLQLDETGVEISIAESSLNHARMALFGLPAVNSSVIARALPHH